MTDLYRAAERAMRMTDDDWLRHANPWSGWTRLFFGAPLMVLAVWARVWIGGWAILAFALVLAWVWFNPRAFPPPKDYGSWMSRGVLGERIFLARDRYDIPAHHLRAAHLTTALAFLGVVPAIWGLIVIDAPAVILGTALAMLAKTWFVDRMVWIHADLTGTTPGTPLTEPLLPPHTGAE